MQFTSFYAISGYVPARISTGRRLGGWMRLALNTAALAVVAAGAGTDAGAGDLGAGAFGVKAGFTGTGAGAGAETGAAGAGVNVFPNCRSMIWKSVKFTRPSKLRSPPLKVWAVFPKLA